MRRLISIEGTYGQNGLPLIPNELLPSPTGKRFSEDGLYYKWTAVVLYGMETWGDLFTTRQKLSLATIASYVERVDDPEVAVILALALDKSADGNNVNARWMPGYENPANLFARQALSFVWDFCESTPQSSARGVFFANLDAIAEIVKHLRARGNGQAVLADACSSRLPDETATVWFTDPPYYDAIPYAELSDFFFVWLKRALPGHPLLRDPFDLDNRMTPKAREIIETLALLRGAPKARAKQLGIPVKDRQFFEERMAQAFAQGRRVLRRDGIGCVVFAHKTTEGWEALLSGLVRAGWVVTASWPITTEMGARLRARESAALSASIHLVLRPRPENAGVGYWDEIMRELPRRTREWMDRLSTEGIRGADLVFSCIGPAMELFSKYSRVETVAGDEEVGLAGNLAAKSDEARNGFLWYIWQVVGRTALQRILGSPGGDPAGVLEEDARLTALFLWTMQSTGNGVNAKGKAAPSQEEQSEEEEEDEEEGEAPLKRKSGFTLIYDVARRFAQPLGIHLDQWQGRIVEIEKGLVRLVPVVERAQQLFGHEGAGAIARRIASAPENPQLQLFPDDRVAALAIRGSDRPAVRDRRRRKGAGEKNGVADDKEAHREATTLDRIHAAMLLQASGQAAALRALLEAETRRGPAFVRLANALSALYPKDSEEKRLVDAMLLAVPRR
jgi:hypothetical protein